LITLLWPPVSPSAGLGRLSDSHILVHIQDQYAFILHDWMIPKIALRQLLDRLASITIEYDPSSNPCYTGGATIVGTRLSWRRSRSVLSWYRYCATRIRVSLPVPWNVMRCNRSPQQRWLNDPLRRYRRCIHHPIVMSRCLSPNLPRRSDRIIVTHTRGPNHR
jgi:hypothetical protein